MASFGFNVSEYDNFESSGSYEPIPEGDYQLMCEEAEEKRTKAGTGSYIKAKFRVLGPTNANRVLFVNFNTSNPSAKAEEIGRKQLSGWARACGNPNCNDTDQLLNVAFTASVGIEKGSGDYGPQNNIAGFRMPQGAAPNAASPAPARTAPAAVASAPAAASSKPAGKKAPWDE
jgi:hypothetical protein